MEVLMFLLISSFYIMTGNAVNPGCECLIFSGTYGKDYGRFTSPDFPKPYPSGIDCLLYNFIAGSHEVIELVFNHFDMHQTSPDCTGGDFLKVFLHLDSGGVNELTPWTGLLCGRNPPRVLYSSGPALVLQMHTRSPQANSSGFDGTFRFINKDLYKSDGTQVPGTNCDYRFVKRKGKFYSPLYPSSYARGTRCSYIFRAKIKERIIVTFEELNLQSGDLSCLEREDVVKVHDGGSSVAPVMAVLCNELSTTQLISTSNQLYIEFVAGSEWPGHGFQASYEIVSVSEDPSPLSTDGPAVSATRTSCDVILSSDSQKEGFITSPNYPLLNPTNVHCKYHLIGSGKERIQIVFKDFNLSVSDSNGNKECDQDSLSVYMLIDGEMERTSTLCGDALPASIMSNGPRIVLELKSQILSHMQGFRAQYLFTKNFGITTGKQLSQYPCAFRFSSDDEKHGYFYSPNFPGSYPRDVECHFLFHGKYQERVKIHFAHFDIEGILPCKTTSASDYVEFSNYMSRENKNSRHCGQLEPFEIESENKFFRVTFKSNDRLDGGGFNASYKFVDKTQLLLNVLSTNRTWHYEMNNILLLIVTLVFIFR
ncbi:suppressor of lurcher protein 1 [Halyomorpha halys]|uniref:suppressor of lurcher protein 1 n=1 Tax=Halyomorpha halys TaxID=286706 RepID=UPI0006D4F845|nr:suppressor of lurcher protein 1-like [Halyomorpha halys]